MKYSDLFQESYSALTVNKVRSSLTMLGIIIGIASVIAMLGIGQGAQSTIQSSIQSIGSNLVVVTSGITRGPGAQVSAGRGSSQTLTVADEQALEKGVTDAKAFSPEISKRFQVVAKGTNTNTSVLGTTPSYAEIRNQTMETGIFITAQQVTDSAKVAVLGSTTRDDLFGAGSDPTGQSVRINQVQFQIIGVMNSKGGSGFFNQDDMIIVPLSAAQHFLSGGNFLSSVDIEAASSDVMSSVQQEATNVMLAQHHIADPALADFNIVNQADVVATASSATGVFTILLASIAGISLVVGGIGIMNMMLTTVTERTREIGLRKAIGATRGDINRQFLTEAIMITFLGGIIGIGIGWLIAMAVSHFAGITTVISFSSIVLAFGVSAAIGLVFGYYPARRASRLSPIEALRFE